MVSRDFLPDVRGPKPARIRSPTASFEVIFETTEGFACAQIFA